MVKMKDEFNIFIERIKDKYYYFKFICYSRKLDKEQKKTFKKKHGMSEETFDTCYELFKKW